MSLEYTAGRAETECQLLGCAARGSQCSHCRQIVTSTLWSTLNPASQLTSGPMVCAHSAALTLRVNQTGGHKMQVSAADNQGLWNLCNLHDQGQASSAHRISLHSATIGARLLAHQVNGADPDAGLLARSQLWGGPHACMHVLPRHGHLQQLLPPSSCMNMRPLLTARAAILPSPPAAAAAGEGWVSGYAKMPKNCAGIPLRTCRRCLNSKSAINCLKCASNRIFNLGLLEALMSPADTLSKADACADCYNSTRPAVCVGCLTSNAPCAECALQNTAPAPTADGWPAIDVGSCVNCTMYHGEAFKSACMSCSYMEAGSKEQSQCFSCLDSMVPLACKPESNQQDCWNPTYGGDPGCSTCTSSAHNPNVCYGCLHGSPYSPYCATCAAQFNDTRQERCYQCISDTKHSRDGCIGCLHYENPAEQEQCLSCLKNPALSDGGKNYCSACMGWCNTKESRAQCMQCLADTPNDASQDQWYRCSCNPDAHPHYGMAHGVAGPDDDW